MIQTVILKSVCWIGNAGVSANVPGVPSRYSTVRPSCSVNLAAPFRLDRIWQNEKKICAYLLIPKSLGFNGDCFKEVLLVRTSSDHFCTTTARHL